MSTSTWTQGALNQDWADPNNWSPTRVPGVDSDVVIAHGEAIASASIGTVNSITDSSILFFQSAGMNTVTTFLNNTNILGVDADVDGEGGTTLNIGGTLTNSRILYLGNSYLSASTEVSAAALDITGKIRMGGSAFNQTDQALLDITASAGFGTAGVLSGNVQLSGDSAIEFASGQITSLAANATLLLYGNDAFIEDSTALGSNSALAGLASIDAGATFKLQHGASVSTTGALTNAGTINIEGGVDTLSVFRGAVSGKGVFDLDGANLRFGSSVSAGQTINESGADHLTLKQAQKFHATISGFGTNDTIDAANFLLSGTTFNFAPNSGGTGGTLSLHDGSLTANILMTGDYSKSSFTLTHDSGTDTLVKFV